MGRRVADLTTPVSVLCYPALVGVRGWKTTGDKNLLQSWGLQCSVGVQTSPGISKPLTRIPEILSDNISQTSNVTRETKSAKEKNSILKQIAVESKIKKEVTFRAARGKDVALCHGNSGQTYCYARAVRSNPTIAGTVTRDRPKVKSAVRYINGSVVDSEAIGGISEEHYEIESVQKENLCGKGVQHHYADHSGKTLVLSTGRPFALPPKMFNDCVGRQCETPRVAIHGVSSPTSDAYPQEKPVKCPLSSFSATAIFQDHQIEKKLNINPQFSMKTSKMTQATVNQELKLSKTLHPACPVHSKGNLANVRHASGFPTSIQPATVLQSRATTVTKATIESRQNDTSIKHSAKPPQDHENPLQLSIALTPQVPKPNDPHTSVELIKTTHCSSSQESQNITTFEKVFGKEQTSHMAPTLKATNEPKSQQMKSQSTNTIGHISQFDPLEHRLLKSTQLHSTPLPDKPPSIPSDEVFFADTAQKSCDLLCLAQPPKTTAKHLDQVVFMSTNHKTLNLHNLTQAASSNSESAVHVSACPPTPSNTIFNPRSPESSALTSVITYKDSSCKNALGGTITVNLTETAPCSASQASRLSKEPNISWLTGEAKIFSLSEASDINKSNGMQDADIQTQDSNEAGVIPDEESDSKTPPSRLSGPHVVSEDHNIGSDASSHSKKTLITPNVKLYSTKNKVCGNLINNLEAHEPEEHQHAKHPQVTHPQTFISLIKPSTSCLQGCLNTKQQRLEHYQGCTDTNHKGQCATSLAVTTAPQTESNRQQFALGVSAWHASTETPSSLDRQTLPNYSPPAVKAQINCEPVVSLTNTEMQTSSTGNEQSSAYKSSDSDVSIMTQAHKSLDCSVTATVIGEGGHSTVRSIVGLKTSSEVQSSSTKAPRKENPVNFPTQPDTNVAHAHPAKADQLLPPFPQRWKSATLQQKLEAVEASLEANKDRISILLNIIHDLEMCRTSSSCWRCCESGQDLKKCSTCQKTACIMYSVEYDFRQQERRFLEILSNSAAGNKASSVHPSQHPNFGLLRKAFIKNLTKTKLKSKKLCKMLLKWLPRKIQQV
ncbi:uncharacterized protein LOC105355676 [Oryzias latipes]|uniref:Uncharacterized protein n=1 Tax=Oryzias latipes TaxID=8090 RepID=A0A3B3HYY8_ORYLA|nr:uncharacterized protein LOC105355676 [Oryzias latipes]